MSKKPEQLYLDLMKKTLSFSLWPEPAIPVEAVIYTQPSPIRLLFSLISRVLKIRRLELGYNQNFTTADRYDGKVWPGYADTMIGMKRLDNLQFCLESVLQEGVEGDMIETGVWRGGACIFMNAVLEAYGISNRKVFVADSFQGLPPPDEKWAADKGDIHHVHNRLAVTQQQVEDNFRKYGLFNEHVVFLKGWFKDTLPKAPIQKLSILRLDGDMYGSTMDALTNLYPKLSKGGFCIIDDYALEGCRKAVSDFRAKYNIESALREIDWSGTFWKKE